MTAAMRKVFFLFCLMLPSSVANSMEVDVAARYGGSIIAPGVVVEGPDWSSEIAGMDLVAADLIGPELGWGLRPAISGEYHWSGGSDRSRARYSSESYGFGPLRSFRVGHAWAQLSALATHYHDTYGVQVFGGDRTDYVASQWGVTAGLDLRFAFLAHVDAVVGYRLHWRKQVNFISEGAWTERSYTVEGQEWEYALSAGFVVKIGDM